MLEPGDILVDCTGSKSVLRDRLVPGADDADGGANTATHPARVRARHHVPVRPIVRMQRSTASTTRTPRTTEYKFIPSVHRTYYDGNVSHVTGIVNITRRSTRAMPPQFDGKWLRDNFPERRPIDGPLHRQDQAGDAWRAHRRSGDRPHPAESLPGSQRDEPQVAHEARTSTIRSRARRCFFSAIPRSARRISSRFRWDSSARCSSRGSSRNPICR